MLLQDIMKQIGRNCTDEIGNSEKRIYQNKILKMVKTIEVENEKTIEILHTIESIERVNKTIERNIEMGMSKIYIQQWQDIKNEHLSQLSNLLSGLNIVADLKAA